MSDPIDLVVPMHCEITWYKQPEETTVSEYPGSDLTEVEEARLNQRADLLIDFNDDPTKQVIGMINVELESEAFQQELPEMCIFCNCVGRHWHKATNQPMCKSCANTHDVADITTASKPDATILRQ